MNRVGRRQNFFSVVHTEALGFKGLKNLFKFRERYLTYSQYLKCRENSRSKWFVGELIVFFYMGDTSQKNLLYG